MHVVSMLPHDAVSTRGNPELMPLDNALLESQRRGFEALEWPVQEEHEASPSIPFPSFIIDI